MAKKIAKNINVTYDKEGDVMSLKYNSPQRTTKDVDNLSDNRVYTEIKQSLEYKLNTGKNRYTRKAWKKLLARETSLE